MPPRADRRLWLACSAATLLHLALLFGLQIVREPAAPLSLEVTLLAVPGSQTPLAARILAPVASTGGGALRALREPAARAGGPLERAGLRHAADLAPQTAAERNDGLRILNSPSAGDSVRSGSQATPRPGTDAALLLQRREQAGDHAFSDDPHASREPVSDESPATIAGLTTRASRQAAYRELWRRQVERAGAANFPWSALTTGRPKSLTLLVTLRTDGTVAQTRVLRSSGLPSLDQAALNILRAAAPFPPFPDDLRRDTTELSFVHVWEFLPGDRAALRLGR